jgi:AraC family ethanolamine operon transcriptional activator
MELGVDAGATPTAASPCAGACSARRITVRDVDDQAEGLHAWEQRYAQLTPGPFEGTLHEVRMSGVQIFHESASQALHQAGRVCDDRVAVGMPVAAGAPALFRGEVLHAHAAAVLGAGELDLYAPPGFAILAVAVPHVLLAAHAATVDRTDAPSAAPRSGVVSLAADARRRLCCLLGSALACVDAHPVTLAHARSQRMLAQTILGALLDLFGHPRAHLRNPAVSRRGVVAQAREYMHAHIDQPVSVADLCAALGVSRRTLQYSFQDVLHIKPVAFLRALRLDGVRRELKQARDTGARGMRVCVQDVAARWGFWHLGHFVAEYRRMFGELPSHTLRGGAAARIDGSG